MKNITLCHLLVFLTSLLSVLSEGPDGIKTFSVCICSERGKAHFLMAAS